MRALQQWLGFGLGVALVAVACSNGGESGPRTLATLAEGCTINSDCNDPLVCAFQRCHTQCNETRDCAPGQRCVKSEGRVNVCLLPEEAGCITTQGCQGDQICAEDRSCRDACNAEGDCIGNQICSTSGACAEPGEVDGEGNLPSIGGAGGSGGRGGAGGGAGEGGETGSGASGGTAGGTGGGSSGGSGGEADGGETGSGGSSGRGITAGGGGISGTAGSAGAAGMNTGGMNTGGMNTGGMNTGGPVPDDDGRGESGPLVMQVTAMQTPATPGGRVLYAVTVGNTSNADVDGVSVLFRVPEGLQFHFTQDAHPDSAPCGDATCAPAEEASWNLGTLKAGSTKTIAVNPLVLGTVGTGDEFSTLFRLTATGVSTLNVTKVIPVDSLPPAEMTFVASHDPIVAGELVEFEVDVGQLGDTALTTGALTVQLPGGLTPQSASDGGALELDRVSWNVASVPVGATLRRSLTALVGTGVTPGDVLNPRATFSYDGGPDTDHVAQIPVSVVEVRQPLTLTIGASGVPAVPNRTILYTATVSNTSQRAIDGVTLLMRVPPELTFHFQQDADPDPAACYDATCAAAEEAHWTLGSLPPGTTTTVIINPAVVAAAAGDGTLVTPFFTLGATDRNPIHRLITHPAKSRPEAELVVVTDAEPVLAGQQFTIRLRVGQVGAAPLSAAALELTLPPGLALGTVSNGGSASGGVVTWDLGSIPVAGGAERTAVVTVDDGVVPGTALQARATLTHDGGDEIDATDALSVSVVAAPLLLSVSVDALPDPAISGQPVLYTTTITNNSSRAVENVSLLLRVPFGVQFHYTTDADPDSAACYDATCAANEEAVWTFPSLAVGASQSVTLNARTATTLVGGSLITLRQRVTATDLGGRINLKTTVGTESP